MTKKYFLRRTDRGYNNYFSEEMRKEVCRVYEQNLKDLKFDDYEESLHGWLILASFPLQLHEEKAQYPLPSSLFFA